MIDLILDKIWFLIKCINTLIFLSACIFCYLVYDTNKRGKAHDKEFIDDVLENNEKIFAGEILRAEEDLKRYKEASDRTDSLLKIEGRD